MADKATDHILERALIGAAHAFAADERRMISSAAPPRFTGAFAAETQVVRRTKSFAFTGIDLCSCRGHLARPS